MLFKRDAGNSVPFFIEDKCVTFPFFNNTSLACILLPVLHYNGIMKNIYFIILFFYGGLHSAQPQSYSLSLFYDINKVEPEAGKLNTLLNFTEGGDSGSVTILGYADFLGSVTHNMALSQKRADAVKYYLINRQPALRITSCKGYGEAQSHGQGSVEGEPQQRRVDVLATRYVAVKKTEPVVTAPVAPVKQPDSLVTPGIEKLEKGQSMELKGLLFVPGKHTWTKDSEKALLNLLSALRAFPDLKIEIQGHICCIDGPGDALDYDTYEKRLSENRARAVYDYLVRNGIEGGRLIYKGYGHTQPKIDPERNSFHEQMNRRVEIKVLEN
jgi:outer membrane protein OmpA-like peptidoglycan-associated protein